MHPELRLVEDFMTDRGVLDLPAHGVQEKRYSRRPVAQGNIPPTAAISRTDA